MAMPTFIKLRPAQQSYGKREQVRKCNDAMYQMELQTWQPYRLFGLFSAIWALALTTVSVCNNYWFISKDVHAGIWNLCYVNITLAKKPSLCADGKPYWQNAVIGLLVFSVAFGFIATILSISGVCATQLPRKIYYYHSAGEIYLICALSCMAGLIVYPSALASTDIENADLSYGVGYGLGWGAAFFFLTSAVCMCLDDLVRAFARGFCQCLGRRNNNDTRV